MKKLIVIALALSSVASFAFAQGRFGQGQYGQARFGSASGTASSTGAAAPGIRNTDSNNRKSARQELGRLMMIAGAVKSVGGGSLVLSNQRGDYTVNTTSTTRVVNRVWKSISLIDIRTGDKVRVYGRVKTLTVAAISVRDISLPPRVTGAPSGISTSTSSSTTH